MKRSSWIAVSRRRAGAAALALATFAPRVMAEPTGADKAAAQALFDQAKDLLLRGNASEACPKLEESQRLDPTSGTLINLAACYEQDGKIAAAWSTFLQAAAAAAAGGHIEREQVARERASALAPRVSKIVINVAGPDSGLEVRRDGMLVGRGQWGASIPVEIGAHTISATAPGRSPWSTVVTIRGESESVTVTIPTSSDAAISGTVAPTRAEPDPQRTWAYVAGGVGLAGIVTGTIFGLVSKSKRDQADEHCTDTHCRDAVGVDLRSQAHSAGNVSTIAFIAGVAGLGTGAALWLTSSAVARPSAPRIGVALGGVVVSGAW